MSPSAMNQVPDHQPLFGKVALIGVGLIGSSLARALHRHGLAGEIVGHARTEEGCVRLLELELCDSAHSDPAEAVQDADLVILCVPVSANADLAEAMAPGLKRGAIVSDVGSVKQAVIRDVDPFLPEGVHFIPGHPIAGTEHSGPEAGFAELFENRYVILTPPPGADEEALEKLSRLWQACGSTVEVMDPAHHDKVLAITSHLPHLIAYTIVGTAANLEESERREVVKYSASGFRDFTRIAASDPIMWRDIFLNNREAVLEMLQRFSEDITALQRAIRWGEGETLESLFRHTREIRRGVVELGQAGTFDPREPEKASTAEPIRKED
ncbi:prephenate/arogenate dehydrogenase family protein [Fodinicurvata fenggangensis]|uniref:prephenate/arogenate dehydrogenase family protein n=1 Tax=Fodinicurvata fenggangensis TaxID=1121830 RepID=UPI000691F86C|nr:prephenate/arogenate dehydrogenase family protein [Fodinicurvata fenggangensis]